MNVNYENESIKIEINKIKETTNAHSVIVSSKKKDVRFFAQLEDISFSSLILRLSEIAIDKIDEENKFTEKYNKLKAGISLLNNE